MNKDNSLRYVLLVPFLLCVHLFLCANPKISIITSVYKGDAFIEGFLADITRQTIFDQCELIMINANSPDNEELVIKKYAETYPNIIYKRLDHDPGIYGVWNIAIEMSRGQYITNANLDDRLSPECYQVHARALDLSPDSMLVYSSRYMTSTPNETFEMYSGDTMICPPKFSKENMYLCLPGCNPMWRRSLHDRYGLFDADYKSSGDLEMWLRAVEGGAKFKRVSGCYCLCYLNPKGLSTSAQSLKQIEDQKIVQRYSSVWKNAAYDEYYQLARQLDKRSQGEQRVWSLALFYYLKAFSQNNQRAEPLVRIAQHYYDAGNLTLTYLFARRACDLPYCETADVDGSAQIYGYVRYDLLSIAAWYLGQFDVGEQALQKALEFYPHDEHLSKNLAFYVNRRGS